MSAWQVGNQRYLEARIALLRERLAAHARTMNGEAATVIVNPTEYLAQAALREMPDEPALDRVSRGFGLSPFESEIVVLCAAAETDPSIGELCAAIGNTGTLQPTFAVALSALADPHWSALTPAAALRYWKLLDVRAGDSLVTSTLRLDERILHFLFGISYRDPRLGGIIRDAPPPAEVVPSHDAIVRRVVDVVRAGGTIKGMSVVSLCGGERASQLAIASAAAARLSLRLQIVRAVDVPVSAAERDALARLWEREAVLENASLLVDGIEGADTAAAAFVDDVRGVVFTSGRDGVALSRRTCVRFDVIRPTAAEQRELWHNALGDVAASLEEAVQQVAAHFTLSLSAIRSIARQVTSDPSLALWQACRAEARTRLDSLANRIVPVAAWNDLVLPEPESHILRQIAAHVRQRHTVYERWGFSARGQRDLGVTALFAGSTGTGKTMAAEILAAELELDLYRIDLSQMVSKYIGETEKNLSRIFDAGEDGGAILLFDEADALFGRRSEVRDSHDRYANLEVSYLLQRMESYRGLAILTTNLKGVLDPAFLRRIRFVVNFPFPNAEQRARIWAQVFPASAPVDDIDVQKLARLNVAGGNIRNIALHAAFLAAEEGIGIRMRHLARAAHGEYAKLEKPLTETGGWT